MNEHRTDIRVEPRKPPSPADENPVDLLKQLTSQGAHLAQEQMHLMQAELREAVADLKQAIGAMAGAAVVGIAGLGVTLMALAYLLGDAIDDIGLGTLIVGVVTLIVAAILYSTGRQKMQTSNLAPDRTIRTVKDDRAAATGRMPESGPKTGMNHGH